MNYRKWEAKDAARAQFRGVWAAITTPFTPDDLLDEAGLRRNMRHMSSAAPFTLQTAAWRPMRDYVELALSGRFDEAERVSRSMNDVRVVAEKWLRDPWVKHKVIPIAQLKAWSEYLGLAGGPVRAPLLALGAQEREALRADLERLRLKERRAADASLAVTPA